MLSDAENQRSPVVEGELIAGKYRVDKVLGAGGMGVVVAATHTDLDQRVALKFVLPHVLPGKESVERFFREARSTAKLTNEHITRVYDVGRLPSGAPYIVMELLDGSDLAQIRKRVGKFPVPDAVEYVLQACEGLVEAHTAGIVHRDLKPQNLFVMRRMNGAPLVKILDFGISKVTGAAAVGQMNLTDSASVLGSPLYMSPEQMRSARSVDARSDIWALGVILYELLAGRVPFDGESVTELCLKVVIEAELPIGQLRDDLPPGLAEIVHRCLSKEPAGRFGTVAALADALDPYSRSASQGAQQLRSWRSFSDTAEASGPNELSDARSRLMSSPPSALGSGDSSGNAARSADFDKSNTQSTWGETRAGSAGARRKRTLVGGLAAGLGVAILAGAGFFVFRPSPPVGVSSAANLHAGATGTPAPSSAPQPIVQVGDLPLVPASADPPRSPVAVGLSSVRKPPSPSLSLSPSPSPPLPPASAKRPEPPSRDLGSGSTSQSGSAPAASATTVPPNGAPILR